MPIYVTPGVYFETVDVERHPVQPFRAAEPLRTDIAGFVGIAEQGPVGRPVQITSWHQFQTQFGGFIPGGYLAYVVKGFFENGGRACYVVRVAPVESAPVVVAEKTVKGVKIGDRKVVLEGSLDVYLKQGDRVRLKGEDLGTTLAADATKSDVEVILDSLKGIWAGTKLEFLEPAARKARAVLKGSGDLENERPKVLRVEAANEGAWGNRVSVRVQRVYGASTVATQSDPEGTSSVVSSITGFEPKSWVRIRDSQGNEQFCRIKSVNHAEWRLIWDKPLSGVDLEQTLTLDTLEFTLSILEKKRVKEIFSRLSMQPGHPRYVEDVVNAPPAEWERPSPAIPRSALVTVAGLRPGQGVSPDDLPLPGEIQLEGGADGLEKLTVHDFLGHPDPLAPDAEKWGLSAFDRVDEVSIVAIPDILVRRPAPAPKPKPPQRAPTDPCLPQPPPTPAAGPEEVQPVELPPEFHLEQISQVQQALLEHCEAHWDRVAILDAPARAGGRPFSLAEIRDWRSRFDSQRGFGALYYPWLKVLDPLRLGGQRLRAIPPSGHVAGLYARMDTQVGVHKAPANEGLRWAEDVTVEINDAQQGVLNPDGINVIRTFPGRGIRVYGARTLSQDPNWRFINVRRLLSMIEEALDEGMQWAVFEPNNFLLRQGVLISVTSFLETLWRDGALVGATAQEAFFVKCDETNNPPEIVDQGKLICDVGVAPTIPAEFVVFRIGRSRDELEIIEE